MVITKSPEVDHDEKKNQNAIEAPSTLRNQGSPSSLTTIIRRAMDAATTTHDIYSKVDEQILDNNYATAANYVLLIVGTAAAIIPVAICLRGPRLYAGVLHWKSPRP